MAFRGRLLLADLQAVANGLRRDGRAALAGRFLPPLILAGMYWMLGHVLLHHSQLLPMIRRAADPIGQLTAYALSPCPVVAGWIGFAQAQRLLFEAPELDLWLAAPLWRGRAALQVLLRAGGTALLWATALSLPMLWQLLDLTRATAIAYALLPLAIATAVLPSLCAVMAIQLVMMRLARGRGARLVLGGASTLAAFGFPMFLLAQVFTGTAGQAREIVDATQVGARPSPLVAAASRLVDVAMFGEVRLLSLWPPVALLATALVAFACLAPLHPAAVQNHRLAHRPRRLRHRPWPDQPHAAVRRKELAQLLQQPGPMLHMLLVGVMVYVLAAERVLVAEVLDAATLPPSVRAAAAMLTLWFLGVLMLLYAHMGRLAVWDGPQWSLYLQAPVRPRALLRAKLQVVAALLAWPLVVAATAGLHWFGAGLTAVAIYLGFAVPGSMLALSAIAVVGTWPWLVRRELDGRLTQGSRGLIGSLALVFLFYLLLSPAVFVWMVWQARLVPGAFADEISVPLLVVIGLLFAATVLAGASWLAVRNYRKLLRAR